MTRHAHLCLAVALAGCAFAAERNLDGGARGDAAAGSDAAIPAAPGETASADGAFSGCLDGNDGDFDTALDCADTECTQAPSCCVGSTTSACCGEPTTDLSTALSSCGATCGGIPSAPFGATRVDAEGFHPAEENADGGFVLDLPLDPRAGALTLTASVRAPMSDRSLDLVTFGFTTETTGAARVLPLVAVQVNGATRTVSLLVGETVVASTELATEAATDYTLTLSPSGAVTVSGVILSAEGVPVGAVLRPVVYGRTDDPSASASIETLSIQHATCDIPAALDPAAITLVDEAGVFVAGTEQNPSLARDDAGVRFLAFDAVRVDDPTRRGVFIAEETSPLRFVVRNPSAAEPQPVIASIDVEEFVDPELTFVGGQWFLFAAGEANGVRSIFRSQGSGGLAFATPIEISIAGTTGSLDSPSLFPGALDRLLARETDELGATRIVELRLPATAGVDEGAFADAICGVDDVCESTTSRDTRYILAARGGVSFDAEEVDAPSLVRVGQVYRLYYAGRRGNRWATGLVVSEDGAYWRRISETAFAPDVVIGADPELAPLGARGASVSADETTLTVVYEGFRGTRSTFLVAQQSL